MEWLNQIVNVLTDFPVWAVAVATVYYTFNLIVDYFVPIVGDDPHHTRLPVSGDEPMYLDATALGVAGAGATAFTLLALFVAMSIRVAKLSANDRRRR